MADLATKDFYNEVPLTLMGEKTPKVVIYKSESHKLHQAFTVADGKTIVKGQPVQLTEDGSIEPYQGAEGSVYLGVAVTDSVNPCYPAQRNFPAEVTVMVEGYVICQYVTKEGLTTCGFVAPTDDEPIGGRFPVVEASKDETKFINLTLADKGEIAQILIR